MHLKKFSFLILMALSIVINSCYDYEIKSLNQQFSPFFKNDKIKDSLISLNSIVGNNWEKLYVRNSYLPDDYFKNCGVETKVPSSILEGTEGADEYLFAAKNKIVKYLKNEDSENIIILRFEESLLNGECGISNNSNIYVKQIPSSDSTFKGYILYIFLKKL